MARPHNELRFYAAPAIGSSAITETLRPFQGDSFCQTERISCTRYSCNVMAKQKTFGVIFVVTRAMKIPSPRVGQGRFACYVRCTLLFYGLLGLVFVAWFPQRLTPKFILD
jgi:hypothetical protein